MTISATIITFDPGLLLVLNWFWGLRLRGETCRGGRARRRRVRRRSRGRSPSGCPRSGRKLAHTHLLLGILLSNKGRARLRTPHILAAALLAPAPLWRPATVPLTLRLAVPLPTSLGVLQSSPQLRLEPPPRIRVVVVEGALATRARDLPAAIHGGAKDPRSGAGGSCAPQPLFYVEE
jgi:hypothetical protein